MATLKLQEVGRSREMVVDSLAREAYYRKRRGPLTVRICPGSGVQPVVERQWLRVTCSSFTCLLGVGHTAASAVALALDLPP